METATLLAQDGTVVCARCRLAVSPLARMKGLLGRASLDPDEGMLFRPGGSIHMFFMRFSIDAVFCTRDLEVVDVVRGLPPVADRVAARGEGRDRARRRRRGRRRAWRPPLARYDRRVSTQPLRQLLESAFPDATELDVIDRTGGGDHFQVVVTSPSLAGLSLVEQHRRVYEALSGPLGDGTIHELRIKTKGAA